jgi:membrane protease YdiL (CAAX protease family)
VQDLSVLEVEGGRPAPRQDRLLPSAHTSRLDISQLWREIWFDPKRSEHFSTAALIAILLAYANTDAWFYLRKQQAVSTGPNLSHLSVLAFVLAWAWGERWTPRELGLGRSGIGHSAAWGLLVGLAASFPVRLAFAFLLVSHGAFVQPELHRLSTWRLLWFLSSQTLLSTAVFEEVAFRGVLHAKLVRVFGLPRALAIGGAVFAAWHGVITWYNLGRSSLPRPLFSFLYAGAMAALFGAGLTLGILRVRTGHLAGGIVAHWLVLANIALSVARPRDSQPT